MATDTGSVALIRKRLTPDEREFLDGMSEEEIATLSEIAAANGLDYVVQTWGSLRWQVEFIRSL